MKPMRLFPILLALTTAAAPVRSDDLLRIEPGPRAEAAYEDFAEGNKTQACEALMEQIRGRSPDPWAYRHAAICAAEIDGFQQSFSQILEAQDDALALWGSAYLSFRQDQFITAEQKLRRAIELRPRFPLAWNLLGASLEKQERQIEAIQAFEQALDIAPDLHFARSGLARLAFNQLVTLLPVLRDNRAFLLSRAELIADLPILSMPSENRHRLLKLPKSICKEVGNRLEVSWAAQLTNSVRSRLGQAEAWRLQGRSLLQLGLNAVGIDTLRRAAERAQSAQKSFVEGEVWLDIGLHLRGEGRYQEAGKFFQKAQGAFSKVSSSNANQRRAYAALEEAQVLVGSEDKRSIKILRSLPSDFLRWGNTLLAAHAWVTKGVALFNIGDFQPALAAFRKGRSLYEASDALEEVANTLNREALLHLKLQDFQSSAEAHRAAGAIQQSLGYYMSSGDSLFRAGSALSRLELKSEASLEAFSRSLESFRTARRQFENRGNGFDIGQAWYREGTALLQLRETAAALEAFQRARRAYPDEGAGQQLGSTWLQEGFIHLPLKHYAAAAEAFGTAHALFREEGLPQKEAVALLYQGKALTHLQKHHEALEKIHGARRIFEETGNEDQLASSQAAEDRVNLYLSSFGRLLKALGTARESWPHLGTPAIPYSEHNASEVLNSATEAKKKAAARKMRHLIYAPLESRRDILTRWVRASELTEVDLWWPHYLFHYDFRNSPPDAALAVEASLQLAQSTGRRDVLLSSVAKALNLLQMRSDAGTLAEYSRPWVRIVEGLEHFDQQRAKILISHSDIITPMGSHEEALSSCRRAVRLARRAGSKLVESTALLTEGRLLARLGENDSGLTSIREARRLLEGINAKSSLITEGNTWLYEGKILSRHGQMERALFSFRTAKRLYHRGGDQHSEAMASARVGKIHFHLGENEGALVAYREARAINERIGNLLGEGNTWFAEGRVLFELGFIEDALAAQEESRKRYQQVGAKASLGNSWTETGRVLLYFGRTSAARDAFHKARQLYQEAGTREGEAIALLREGEVLYTANDFTNALSAFRRARELFEKVGALLGQGNAWLNQAQTYLRRNQLSAAIAAASSARKLFVESQAEANERDALLIEALAYHRLKRPEVAVPLAERALGLHERWRQTLITGRHRTIVDQRAGAVFQILIPSLIALNRGDEALKWTEQAKARALLDQLKSSSLHENLGSEDRVAEYEQLRRELARNESARRVAKDHEMRKGLDEERARLLRSLDRNQYERMAQSRNQLLAAEPVEPEEIRALVGDIGPILMFHTTEKELIGFLIQPDGPMRVDTVKVSQAVLRKEIADFGHSLANPLFEERATQQASELWVRLVEPFVSGLPDGSPLTVIPHGPLHQLPFAALEDPEGQRLFDRWDLSVAPSVSALTYARGRHRGPGENDTFVAFASGRGLPLTRGEAHTIAVQFGGTGTVFAPTEARFERYEEFAPDTRHLLIATRGGFAEYSIHGTYLEILPTPGVHDSRLSAAEIAAIPLGAELVVLAACDTARGRALLSDDRLDLTRAFLVAGSAAVLATRWKVPESPATTRFLVDFYRAYRTGGPEGGPIRKDEALTAARRAAIERGDPAQIWAAWVLVGDAR